MHMAIILLPSDNYEHQHIIRATAVNDKVFRAAITQLNPDIHVLHTVADVTPEMTAAAADHIRADDPTHDPLHPGDLTTRDPAKVEAEKQAAAGKAAPVIHDAMTAAREAHAKFKAARAPAAAPGSPDVHATPAATAAAFPAGPKPA